jgi:Lon protease-like protein
MSAAEFVRRSRESQGLPPKVADVGTIARVVALLRANGDVA